LWELIVTIVMQPYKAATVLRCQRGNFDRTPKSLTACHFTQVPPEVTGCSVVFSVTSKFGMGFCFPNVSYRVNLERQKTEGGFWTKRLTPWLSQICERTIQAFALKFLIAKGESTN
jgi:hypothetical protein